MIKKKSGFTPIKSGFTLLETMIVIGIISLILPLIFSIVFSITRQQAKVYVLSTVKREGDNALSVIENLIRTNAIGIYSDQTLSSKVCTTASYDGGNGSSFYFSDKDGNWFNFKTTTDTGLLKIASNSSVLNSVIDLTSTKNTQISLFNISCDQTSSITSPIVSIQFTIAQKQTTSTRVEDLASLNYSTKIKLRSY